MPCLCLIKSNKDGEATYVDRRKIAWSYPIFFLGQATEKFQISHRTNSEILPKPPNGDPEKSAYA